MTSKSDALQASFPWLSRHEAHTVEEALDLLPPLKSAADQMAAIGELLDHRGLPPTSSLLLALAGRGSKGTAVDVARSIARRRFETACASPSDTGPVVPAELPAAKLPVDLSQLNSFLERLQTQPAQDGLGKDILRELGAFRSEFAWLKSCIDTERQLRKHEEKGGALPESKAAASTPTSRANLVASITGGLERARYKAPDQADGVIE